MHAFHITLLVLAASAAAPVFSAPLSSGHARSDLLISRDNDVDNFVNAFLSSHPNTARHVAHDRSFDHFARSNVFDDFSQDNKIQARGFNFGNFLKNIFNQALNFLRRDATPGELATRELFKNSFVPAQTVPRDDGLESLTESLKSLLQSRDGIPELAREQALALALLSRSFDELE